MNEVIGLIPAGGQAKRISPLPCSKELYPIGFWHPKGSEESRPKVACHYLLEKMRAADITKAYIILRQGKWDIPSYLHDGTMVGMHLAYVMLGLPFGVPYTLDQAYPFVQDKLVAFGFPDILFESDDAFVQLLSNHSSSNADITLGLFPAESPQKVDMVDVVDDGRVRQIVAKPPHTHLSYTWGIAVWTPVFTQFLHEYVTIGKATAGSQPELSVGDVIQAAIRSGLRTQGTPVSQKPYLDIGTSENLVRALVSFTSDSA